jgi:hypothetical protein
MFFHICVSCGPMCLVLVLLELLRRPRVVAGCVCGRVQRLMLPSGHFSVSGFVLSL